MKKILGNPRVLGSAVLLAVGTLVLAGSAFLLPTDVEAIEGCPNPGCESPQTTTTLSATDVDCPWAKMDLDNALWAQASCPDGHCSGNITYTQWCAPGCENTQNCTISGFMTYRCARC